MRLHGCVHLRPRRLLLSVFPSTVLLGTAMFKDVLCMQRSPSLCLIRLWSTLYKGATLGIFGNGTFTERECALLPCPLSRALLPYHFVQ